MSQSTPDHVVDLANLPALLERLARQPTGESTPCPAAMKFEVGIAKGARTSMQDMDRLGRRSVLTCPDCNGAMWEIDESDLFASAAIPGTPIRRT